jgi:hypothetical protein
LEDFVARQAKRIRRKSRLYSSNYSPAAAFGLNELGTMRRKYASKNGRLFLHIFNKGILNFECGEFEVAKRALLQCLVFWIPRGRNLLSPNWVLKAELLDSIATHQDHDGPSLALLRRILRFEAKSRH